MLIDTVEKLNEVIPDMLSCMNPVMDVETNGTDPFGNSSRDGDRIIGIAIGTEREAYYFPFRHDSGRGVEENLPMKCMGFFTAYLSNNNRKFGGHNYKFDEHMIVQDGAEYALNTEDSMLGLHLFNENEENFQLKDTCDRYGIGDGSLQESILQEKVIAMCKARDIRVSIDKKSKDNWKGKMWVLPPVDVEPYATDDVRLTRQLLELLSPALQEQGLYDIFKQVNYYSYVTAQMERRGMLLDADLIYKYQEEAKGHSDETSKRLSIVAGYEINVNSSKQVCAFLGGVESSAAEVLDDLILLETPQAENAKMIKEARGWSSVNSRYYTPYLEAMDKDNVLHCSFNLMGTISGRLSCNNPNLQAVARMTEVFKVKDVFIARPGFTLIEADYSQAEMRMASFYGKEENMAGLLMSGADMHTTTAETLGIPRDAAKRINFGVIYGIGAEALHKQIRTNKATAQGYLNKYHKLYPGFKRLYHSCERVAEEQGYIQLWTGRRRHYNVAKAYTHKASSNLIQGNVAEMVRVAMSRLYPAVCDLGGYMLLQVHDSIMIEIPDEQLNMSLVVMKSILEDFSFVPAQVVDIKYGKRWGNMIKWNGQPVQQTQ